MIQLNQLSLQRGPLRLLDRAQLTIHANQKVGIVGANGVGKSSLFKLILGQLQPDEGDLQLPGNLTIAHMAQEVADSDGRAIDYVLDGDHRLRAVQQGLADAEQSGNHHRIGELHAQLDAIDGYSAEARAHQLLNGLSFSTADAQRPVNTFSGGWRIRLNLAQALMSHSDILLLDEPTNHLDLDATIWLEQWLRNYQGTLLLISHDRDFLDAVSTHIVHMAQQKTELYKGGYSDFEKRRAERLAQQQSQFEKQQVRIAEIESFVNRFKAKATKAKQAQSRVKELERMELIAPAHVDSPFSFTFQSSDKISFPLMSLNNAQLGYSQAILKDVKLTLSPGDRIGLLGPNGAGKSTLIKTLTQDLPLIDGVYHAGEHLKIGYFAQHQLEALDLEASPALHIQRISPKASDQEIRNYLGSFDFNGDRALEPVKRFSGGEKARVALALIAWQRPNLLLLDEPTNHLDLEVRHALTLALQNFDGALILVSHDRHLLRNTVDQFWLVANGRVSPFDGDMDDYQQWLAAQRRTQNQTVEEPKENRSLSAAEKKEQKRLEAERRNALRPLRKAIDKLEATLDKVTQELQQVETSLADVSLYEEGNKEQLKRQLQQQGELQQKADAIESEWMEKLEELEQLESETSL
ncbi:ATP-binding cassette domain-containing protein [Amphritea sp. 2_MG-2023]|uniref:ATP-binding cassette domain-containing protein n=1 Tax=Amphritea TaxID=515417 RepID=UPI001C07B83F|nr:MULTISPECIES: ATP-binding cassette domain-containing protein [Amphritea]MBU2967101.1 ATP-binding cassette domain-containing protein [Amphritea atlantica]MDO6419346.1 ATP-binding cassette domain-containing protein [Amphritea sp. 2_MG-2023]